jgi:Tfp pilus assembly protein PilE
MSFFETLTNNVTKAVDYVVEKNRKAALINRIRIVIKNERENQARAYVALGKYYFRNLRDPQNEETERFCKAVETSEQRMKKAFDKLDEITAPAGCDDDDCDDCSCCCKEDDIHSFYDDVEAKAEDDAINGGLDDDVPPSFQIIDMNQETVINEDEEAAPDDDELEKPANPEI